jgi:hypothetical protein
MIVKAFGFNILRNDHEHGDDEDADCSAAYILTYHDGKKSVSSDYSLSTVDRCLPREKNGRKLYERLHISDFAAASGGQVDGVAANWSSVIVWTRSGFIRIFGYLAIHLERLHRHLFVVGRYEEYENLHLDISLNQSIRKVLLSKGGIQTILFFLNDENELWIVDLDRMCMLIRQSNQTGGNATTLLKKRSQASVPSIHNQLSKYCHQIADMTTDIACTSQLLCALSISGTLRMWKIPSKKSELSLWFESNQTTVPPVKEFQTTQLLKSIDAGHSHFLGLSVNGSVYSWGSGLYGQLGHGVMEASRDIPTVIEALAGLKAVSIACGGHHSVVIVEGGIIYNL